MCRWYAIAELTNDVSGSGIAEVLLKSDKEPAILALKESTSTALAGVTVKIEESALYDSHSNGLAESAVEDVKDAVRRNVACLVRRFGQRRTSSSVLVCEVFCCDGEQMQ